MRWQKNPAHRERPHWDLSPRSRLILRLACLAFLAVLVVTHQWAGAIALIVVWSVASVIDAVRT